MPQSLAKIIIHIIFSTKNRELYLHPPIEKDVHAYITSVLNAIDCPVIQVDGMPDHIHILCLLSRTRPVSSLIEEAKKRSSKWIKSKGAFYQSFHWQSGYGVFSVSESKIEVVKNYIIQQKEHHKTITFQDEYRRFLKEYGIAYDEQYVWD